MSINNYRHIIIDKYFIWDTSFALWFITEFCLYHSIFNTIFVAVFIALGILYTIKNKWRTNGILLWNSIFIFICLVNILMGYSVNASNSCSMLVSLIKDLAFLFTFIVYIEHVGIERVKEKIVISGIISSFVIIFLSLIISGSFIVRESNGIFNANYLAVCGSVISVIILSNDKLRVSKRICIILYFALFAALAGTRKALIAIIVGIVVFLCVKYPKKLVKNVFIIILLLIATYLALTKIPFLYNVIGYRFVTAIDFLNSQTGDGSIYMRSWYIKTGMERFYQSPIIGNGINCFRTIQGTLNKYSHNNYVELLYSVGIVGTIIYYSIHVISIVYGLKNYRAIDKTNFCLSFAVIAIVLFVDYSMVSYYERGSLIYIVLFYMLLIKSRRQRLNNDDNLEKVIS